VEHPAVDPDVAVGVEVEVQLPHPPHPLHERLEEGVRAVGELVHILGRLLRPGEQRLVGREQPPPGLQALEVLHVEGVAGGVELGRAAVAAGLAGLGQGRRHPGLQRGVHPVAGLAEAAEPVLEVGAVGLAQRVAAGERDELRHREAVVADEHLDELGRLERGGGQRGGVVGAGEGAVLAARGHVVVGPSGHVNGVPRGEGEHVGAGDGRRALRLEGGLDGVDDLEAAEGLVGERVLLGGAVGLGGVEEHRGVAAADEAVVEVEPEQGRRQGGVLGNRGADHVAHDLGGVRARHGVVLHAQTLTTGRAHAATSSASPLSIVT
uniref:Uncharacterized protein n=1 Tax=Triticum urartu TaxID=4572 RepID=A0A8R7TPL2_TRIUA